MPLRETSDVVVRSQRCCFCAEGGKSAKLVRTSPKRKKIRAIVNDKLRRTGEVFKNGKDLKKEWMKVCKNGGTSVAQNLMCNVKSEVRVFSLGDFIE